MVSFLILSPFRARSRLDRYHTQVLAADITPTLERLREEKSHYLRWSANAAEVSRLERFCVAAEYDEAWQSLATLEQAEYEAAMALKAEGNVLFGAGKHAEAIAKYDAALSQYGAAAARRVSQSVSHYHTHSASA